MRQQLERQLATTDWAVHVYGRDRRLLWVVEPAHAWAFGWGMMCGLLLAIVGYNLRSDATTLHPIPTLERPGNLD